MDDRELLEAAAKAAGFKLTGDSKDGRLLVRGWPEGYPEDWEYWNPLEDDSDALRLAVKLSLMVDVGWDKSTTVEWMIRGDCAPDGEVEQDFDGDPYAATRRAIVRAAAAMATGS